ncbi:hypothetical protein JXR93_11705 [bacterium]|nr:hypothetical protein [bacterium]
MKKLFTLFFIMFLAIGCGSVKMIEGTSIEDTTENRDIISFMNKYNENLIAKNSDTLFSMASKEYYDNGGTATSSKDDFGYTQLKELLNSRFEKVAEIQQKIKIVKIFKVDEKIFVDYEYDAKFRIQNEWSAKKDINQMVLEKTDNGYKILKGM